MNIVVLDGYALNPGDLNWSVFESLGKVTIYDRTSSEQIVNAAADADVILTNKTPLSAVTIRELPKLKYIGVLATGYNNVDLQAATQQGVVVTNVPDYSSASVAQLVFALLLELCMRVQRHSDAVFKGEWVKSPDFSFTRAPLIELAGKTMGIIGYGSIGKQVHRIADGFGMKVVAASRTRQEVRGLRWVTIDELFAQSDVVSLHCPLTEQTAGLVSQARLALMKPTAFLINTSRGGLIREQDLAEALERGQLAGAAVDVLSQEPPQAENPLLTARNCVITPHIAWATKEARMRLMSIAVSNLAAFLRGHAENVVNG